MAPIVDLLADVFSKFSNACSLFSGKFLKNISIFDRETPLLPHSFVIWLFVIVMLIPPANNIKIIRFSLFYMRSHID